MEIGVCVYVYVCVCVCVCMDFSGSSVVKNLPVDSGDPGEVGSIPVRKNPWRRKGQPTPVLSPEKNPMDRGACWAHRIAKSWARLSTHVCTQCYTYI